MMEGRKLSKRERDMRIIIDKIDLYGYEMRKENYYYEDDIEDKVGYEIGYKIG